MVAASALCCVCVCASTCRSGWWGDLRSVPSALLVRVFSSVLYGLSSSLFFSVCPPPPVRCFSVRPAGDVGGAAAERSLPAADARAVVAMASGRQWEQRGTLGSVCLAAPSNVTRSRVREEARARARRFGAGRGHSAERRVHRRRRGHSSGRGQAAPGGGALRGGGAGTNLATLLLARHVDSWGATRHCPNFTRAYEGAILRHSPTIIPNQ